MNKFLLMQNVMIAILFPPEKVI